MFRRLIKNKEKKKERNKGITIVSYVCTIINNNSHHYPNKNRKPKRNQKENTSQV